MGCYYSYYKKTNRDFIDNVDGNHSPFIPRSARSATTYLFCGIYGLILIVIGLVVPISTTISGTVPGQPIYKYYLELFHLYLYGFAILFLFYLHCYLLHAKGPRQRRNSKSNVQLVSNNQLDSTDKSVLAVQENSEISDSKDNHSQTTSEPEVEAYVAEPTRPVTYDATGINFYLRLGAIAFGAGTMILDGFRLAQVFEVETYWECQGILHLVTNSVHLVFTFFQTYFLFKNHRIVVNKHKAFVRFGLTHIMATNICIWVLLTVYETAADYETQVTSITMATTSKDLVNLTTIGNVTVEAFTSPMVSTMVINQSSTTFLMPASCMRMETLARKASPYLFPCVIQYSIIAAAVVYRMYINVGKRGDQIIMYSDDSFSRGRDCHKANKGLFLGLFIAILTLISISCFFVFDEKFRNEDTASMIFYITEMSLLFISCITVLFGCCCLQRLKFTAQRDGSEAPLLVFGLFGLCVMNTFLVISSVMEFEQYELLAYFSLATALLAFIQACIQTIFILDGLRRCAENDKHIRSKPGRTLVTFLLLCNISLIFVNIFEGKKAETLPMHINYYGRLPWNIISHLCIPLLIFYRFHSAVCLSEIWSNAYVMKKSDL